MADSTAELDSRRRFLSWETNTVLASRTRSANTVANAPTTMTKAKMATLSVMSKAYFADRGPPGMKRPSMVR
jgi:hypothetical protein